MKADIRPPDGWYFLETGTKMRRGDCCLIFDLDDGWGWYSVWSGDHGGTVGHKSLIIRRQKKAKHK